MPEITDVTYDSADTMTLDLSIEEHSDDSTVSGVSWLEALKLFGAHFHEEGEWGGAVLPIDENPLMLEPTHPMREGLHNKVWRDGNLVDHAACRGEAEAYRDLAEIWARDRRNRGQNTSLVDASMRLNMAIHSLAPVHLWGMQAEIMALTKLHELVGDHKFKQYFLTGMFLETSQRSGVTYIFRRLRPTVAARVTETEFRFLAALCLHPIGYYGGTHASVMVPTDDVVAHVVMMRGDERRYWARANHHDWTSPTSGV